MSANTPAECLHTEPKHILILTAGEVSPVVLRQWEMACDDFFAANRKLKTAEPEGYAHLRLDRDAPHPIIYDVICRFHEATP
jgi:hypothetical protein